MPENSFPWQHSRRYNDYSSSIKSIFTTRVQKISLNVGFSCPNRDGTIGIGGCSYCNNKTFNPDYCSPQKSIYNQLEQGVSFFAKKYKTQQYLAYFQAYTNTYADIDVLKKMYYEAVSYPGVIGLVIATRSDCVNNEILELIAELSEKYYVVIEYGIESTLNKTLKFINRGHTFENTILAVEKTNKLGIKVGGHMILGLPGESYSDLINHARIISKLPLHTLKLHQLQIIKGTKMAEDFKNYPELFINFSVEQYVQLVVDFLQVLTPDIILERFISESPSDMVLSPSWGLKNFEIVAKIEKALAAQNTWQGEFFKN